MRRSRQLTKDLRGRERERERERERDLELTFGMGLLQGWRPFFIFCLHSVGRSYQMLIFAFFNLLFSA